MENSDLLISIRVNTPDVIHESFDRETVIVNLRLGVYFSLNEAGLPLWGQIQAGTTGTQLFDLWAKTHGVGEAEAQTVVRAFLHELHEEQLVVIDPEVALTGPFEPGQAAAPHPMLQKFTDLQDLLMLDPIHDVDERGWPHAKPVGDTGHPA
ncbi:MAG: PqqD family protein [Chthoniobacteraceae bacterium]